MMLFPFQRRIRHPFFPQVAAVPAIDAHGRPDAIAGSFAELARAAQRGVRARRAVYVVTRSGEALTDGQRDTLWNLFQAPVYALVANGDRIVAWECEAQNGLHAEPRTERVTCECGRPGTLHAPPMSAPSAAD